MKMLIYNEQEYILHVSVLITHLQDSSMAVKLTSSAIVTVATRI